MNSVSYGGRSAFFFNLFFFFAALAQDTGGKGE